LPIGTNHERRSSPFRETETNWHRHWRSNVRQHLPLRDLFKDSSGHSPCGWTQSERKEGWM